MSEMIINVINHYGEPAVYVKCKIVSEILFCMLSNLMMNCGTNFLNTLYMLEPGFILEF